MQYRGRRAAEVDVGRHARVVGSTDSGAGGGVLEVETCTESAPGAGEDDHADGAVAVCFDQVGGELVEHHPGDGVQALGPIQRHGCDMARSVDQDFTQDGSSSQRGSNGGHPRRASATRAPPAWGRLGKRPFSRLQRAWRLGTLLEELGSVLDEEQFEKSARGRLPRRRVDAPLERVWENVHDWEHLPWVHASSFQAIECIDSGAWGWRARLALAPGGREILTELVRDTKGDRYVTRTLAGPGVGTEIWTSLARSGAHRTDVEVEFHLPGVDRERRDAIGQVLFHPVPSAVGRG